MHARGYCAEAYGAVAFGSQPRAYTRRGEHVVHGGGALHRKPLEIVDGARRALESRRRHWACATRHTDLRSVAFNARRVGPPPAMVLWPNPLCRTTAMARAGFSLVFRVKPQDDRTGDVLLLAMRIQLH